MNGDEIKQQDASGEGLGKENFQFEVAKPINQVKIKVIGVGGCGCNVVESMYSFGIRNVEFYVINTDIQALSICKCPNKIQIGTDVTNGLGAGAVPDVGQKAALAAKPLIKEIIQDADMIFITAGLGGGTGTGASPIIAAIARELGILTVAFVTRPFKFEGPQRIRRAEAGLEKLREVTDTMIVVSNEKLLEVVGKKATLSEAFTVANNVLAQGVQSISDLITIPGVINVDFADVKTIIGNTGKAVMGIGIGKGENRACEAVKKACASSLLDKIVIKGASGVLICFSGSNILLEEIYQAMSLIYTEVAENVNIIMGVVVDPSLKDEVKVTIIATGGKNEMTGETTKPSVSDILAAEKKEPAKSLIPEVSLKTKLELMLADENPNPPSPAVLPTTEPVKPVPASNSPELEKKTAPATPQSSFSFNFQPKEDKLIKDKTAQETKESVRVSPSIAEKLNKQVEVFPSVVEIKKEEPELPKNFDAIFSDKFKVAEVPKPVAKNGNGSDAAVVKIEPSVKENENIDIIDEIPSFLRRRRRYFE